MRGGERVVVFVHNGRGRGDGRRGELVEGVVAAGCVARMARGWVVVGSSSHNGDNIARGGGLVKLEAVAGGLAGLSAKRKVIMTPFA